MKYFEKVGERRKKNSDLNSLIAGGVAGVSTSTLVNPLDIYQGYKSRKGDEEKAKAYLKELTTGSFNSRRKAAFRGLRPKAAKVGLAGALSFGIYNKAKDILDAR